MTFVRIWRTHLNLELLDEYEGFIEERSKPMFRAQAGFRGVIFSRSGNEVAVLSFWKDSSAVDALERSSSYQDTVRAIGQAGFLVGGPSVEVYGIDAGLIDDVDGLLH
jgi:heme-degrading monooxygenase HmoA